MLSGKDLEGQASGFKQDNSSIEELETFMQGGKRGEVRLGDQQDNGEKLEAFDADSRKLGDRSDFFINIGSTIIRVGSVESSLQRHG